jgi:hypothetical protein
MACSKINCDPKGKEYDYNFNFDTIPSGTKTNLRGVDFLSHNVGYIVGHNGLIMKTEDGGLSFEHLASGTTNNLWKVLFTSEKIGYVIGDHLTLLKTTDGGKTWKSIFASVPGAHLRAIQFFNDSTGIVAGQSGKIYVTLNGGENWIVRSLPNSIINRNIYSMYWSDLDHGYLGCNWGDFIKWENNRMENIRLDIGIHTASNCGIVDIVEIEKSVLLLASVFSNNQPYPSFNSFAKIIQKEKEWKTKSIFGYPKDSAQLWSMDFRNKKIGVAVGGNFYTSEGEIHCTNDIYSSWFKLPIKSKMLYNVDSFNGKIIIVGDGGTIWGNKSIEH